MKVRIAKQSLRFRLSPEDLAALASKENLTVALRVTGGVEWVFEIRSTSELNSLSLEANGPNCRIAVPKAEITAWLESSSLSWEHEQVSPPLRISIEKDVKPNRDETMRSRKK